MPVMRKVAESTVRRLSLYLRFLEEFEEQGTATVSSGALASLGGTTSAQVR
ncbi:MAG: winged-helix domain-containing protein, partial [Gemmatimonadales bacterium]